MFKIYLNYAKTTMLKFNNYKFQEIKKYKKIKKNQKNKIKCHKELNLKII